MCPRSAKWAAGAGLVACSRFVQRKTENRGETVWLSDLRDWPEKRNKVSIIRLKRREAERPSRVLAIRLNGKTGEA